MFVLWIDTNVMTITTTQRITLPPASSLVRQFVETPWCNGVCHKKYMENDTTSTQRRATDKWGLELMLCSNKKQAKERWQVSESTKVTLEQSLRKYLRKSTILYPNFNPLLDKYICNPSRIRTTAAITECEQNIRAHSPSHNIPITPSPRDSIISNSKGKNGGCIKKDSPLVTQACHRAFLLNHDWLSHGEHLNKLFSFTLFKSYPIDYRVQTRLKEVLKKFMQPAPGITAVEYEKILSDMAVRWGFRS